MTLISNVICASEKIVYSKEYTKKFDELLKEIPDISLSENDKENLKMIFYLFSFVDDENIKNSAAQMLNMYCSDEKMEDMSPAVMLMKYLVERCKNEKSLLDLQRSMQQAMTLFVFRDIPQYIVIKFISDNQDTIDKEVKKKNDIEYEAQIYMLEKNDEVEKLLKINDKKADKNIKNKNLANIFGLDKSGNPLKGYEKISKNVSEVSNVTNYDRDYSFAKDDAYDQIIDKIIKCKGENMPQYLIHSNKENVWVARITKCQKRDFAKSPITDKERISYVLENDLMSKEIEKNNIKIDNSKEFASAIQFIIKDRVSNESAVDIKKNK